MSNNISYIDPSTQMQCKNARGKLRARASDANKLKTIFFNWMCMGIYDLKYQQSSFFIYQMSRMTERIKITVGVLQH